MILFLRVGLFLGLMLFSLSACGKSERFYCNFYKDRDSVSDRMVLLTHNKEQRVVKVTPFWTVGMTFYKTYEEEGKVFSLYKERRVYRYSFFEMDFSSSLPIFRYGYGLHILASDFERIYALAFNPKNFNRIHANPELTKYLPPAPTDYLSISFYKRELECRKINLLQYSGNFVRLIFYYILAG